jgi:SanA protein
MFSKQNIYTAAKRALVLALVSLLLVAGLIGYAQWTITHAAAGKIFLPSDVLPQQSQRHVGLVLGCAPTLANGQRNLYFYYRMNAAAEAFHAGQVDVLLLSGDNSRATYDEPSAMLAALVERGVPAERMQRDYAGFSTLDSILRAKKVFGAEAVCIISQPFHAERAIYLAKQHDLDVIAIAAQDVLGRGGLRTHLREYLARVKAVADIVFNQPAQILGPQIELPQES